MATRCSSHTTTSHETEYSQLPCLTHFRCCQKQRCLVLCCCASKEYCRRTAKCGLPPSGSTIPSLVSDYHHTSTLTSSSTCTQQWPTTLTCRLLSRPRRRLGDQETTARTRAGRRMSFPPPLRPPPPQLPPQRALPGQGQTSWAGRPMYLLP